MYRFIRAAFFTRWTGPQRIGHVGVALVLSAATLVGCSERAPVDPQEVDLTAEFHRSGSRATPIATLGWQEQARSLAVAANLGAQAASRVYALVSLAQYGAINEQDGDRRNPLRRGYRGGGNRHNDDVERGAIAGASWVVLGFLFPASQGALELRLRAEEAAAGTPEFSLGIEKGAEMGARMVAWANADRFAAPWTGTIPVGPGMWTGTSPPAAATLGGMAPYFLTSSSQFRPTPPPAFNSSEFLASLSEVRVVSDTRTPEQLATAVFWNYPTTPGYWNEVADDLIRQFGATEREATLLFGLMNASVMDALIACFEAKYHYWYIRPSKADPAITLPIGLPNHPSYPSGHSCVSASAATVIGHLFPNQKHRLGEQVKEAGLSRLYAGLHYDFDIVAGQELGQSVGRYAIRVASRRGLLSRIP